MTEFAEAFVTLIQWHHLLFLFLGTLLGLAVGIIPGLGGTSGLAIVLPFVFGMDPLNAIAMMMGILAPTTTSDTFPAVLMGVPGTAGSQATVLDGFPLARRGEAARALGAAFAASMVGGLIGAAVLTVAVFYAIPVMLAFGFGEQLALIVLALTVVGSLTGSSFTKGLAACGVGLLLGSIGTASMTGEGRATFGSFHMIDGFSIVAIGLGMFAIPEMVDLLRRGSTISGTEALGRGWLDGLRDAWRHRFLVFRGAILGCIVGALPGLGGTVVDWIAYGHAVQTGRRNPRFGQGDIRGVLAPEAANNAKEGGALIPTLLFGIPGSGNKVILLSGLVLIGIEPGFQMATTQLDMTYLMIWSLALANVIGAGLCLGLAPWMARLTLVPYAFLAPAILSMVFFSAFQINRSHVDLVALVCFGVLGIAMKRFGWSRPALLIGFFLSPKLENLTYQSIQFYGLTFLERPLVIALAIFAAASIWLVKRSRRQTVDMMREGGSGGGTRRLQIVFTVSIMATTALYLAGLSGAARFTWLFPMIVGVPTILLLGYVAAAQAVGASGASVLEDADDDPTGRSPKRTPRLHYVAWLLGFLGLVWLIGMPIAMVVFVTAFVAWHRRRQWPIGTVLGIAVFALLWAMSELLVLRYPGGLIARALDLPWWLGGY